MDSILNHKLAWPTNGNRTGEKPMEFIVVYEKDGSWLTSWQNQSDRA